MTQSTSTSHSSNQKNKDTPPKKQDMKTGRAQKFWHKRFLVVSIWLMGMGGIVLMGAFLWQYYEEETKEMALFKEDVTYKIEGQDMETRIQKLEEENKTLKIISQKMEKLEKDSNLSQGEMAALNARLNTLERNMQANNILSAEMATYIKQNQRISNQNTQGITHDATEIRDLAMRLDMVEKIISLKRESEQKGYERIQALTKIREAVYRGQTFEDGLNVLIQEIGPNDQKIQELLLALKPFSSRGLLTPMDLYLLFPDLADKMSLAVRPDPQNLTEKILNSIENLVSIRPIEENKIREDSFDGSLLKIGRCLEHGDLRKAIEIIRSLDPKAQKVAASWMQNARNYLDVDSILNTIETLIVGQSFSLPTELGTLETKNTRRESSQ